jgi:hypothetical protein
VGNWTKSHVPMTACAGRLLRCCVLQTTVPVPVPSLCWAEPFSVVLGDGLQWLNSTCFLLLSTRRSASLRTPFAVAPFSRGLFLSLLV